MIAITTALLIIAIHFFSDFVCQTHEMAINKSKHNGWLSAHVAVYTIVTLLAWIFLIFDFAVTPHLGTFIIFIFSTHWITDYITSRISSKYFGKGDYHNGFVVVGIDQVFHYIQLLSAYYLFVLNN